MQTDLQSSHLLAKILAGVALALVTVLILVNLPNLLDKTTTILAIPYADRGYIQREEDILGAEVDALKFIADTTEADKLAAWVSDDYQSRQVFVRYWLYPRRVWLGDSLTQAAGQNAGVILVLKNCPTECTTTEITEPVKLDGYRLARQFVVRESVVSVLTRIV